MLNVLIAIAILAGFFGGPLVLQYLLERFAGWPSEHWPSSGPQPEPFWSRWTLFWLVAWIAFIAIGAVIHDAIVD